MEQGIFDTFSVDDILVEWTWKGKPLSDENIAMLKEQAKTLQTSFLWKVLKSEVQWFAVKSLLEKGKVAEDIKGAQLLGLFTMVIDAKLNKMGE